MAREAPHTVGSPWAGRGARRRGSPRSQAWCSCSPAPSPRSACSPPPTCSPSCWSRARPRSACWPRCRRSPPSSRPSPPAACSTRRSPRCRARSSRGSSSAHTSCCTRWCSTSSWPRSTTPTSPSWSSARPCLGPGRIREAVNDTGDLIASVVSLVAAVGTAGALHPLLAPVVLLAALPQGWASVRSARLMFASVLRTNSAHRRRGVTSNLITDRDAAAEVRAFTTQGVLLGEHRRIGDEITADAIRLSRDRTIVQVLGRTFAGIGSALAYLVLGLLLYTGGLPLALAGAAAVAMRTAAQAVSQVVYQTNRLYEASLYVALYRSCLTDARTRRRAEPTARLAGDPDVIALSGVSFHYPGQDERAIDDVTVTLRRGQVIALVGENGSGKSTLAKLITGLYLPAEGSVAWDGVDTATVPAARAARAGGRRDAGPAALADDRGEQRPDRAARTAGPRRGAARRRRRPCRGRLGGRRAARRLGHGAVAPVPGRARPVRRAVAAGLCRPRALPRRAGRHRRRAHGRARRPRRARRVPDAAWARRAGPALRRGADHGARHAPAGQRQARRPDPRAGARAARSSTAGTSS